MRLCMCACILLLVAVAPVSVFAGPGDVYLYDDAVAADVDIAAYLLTGDVSLKSGTGNIAKVDDGPAPPPYPEIHIWEPGYELLGTPQNEWGIRFINVGQHWIKNTQALVLWMITVPSPNERANWEFLEDLTLTMWVDWDQNEQWEKWERVIWKSLNVADLIPAGEQPMTIYYLTKFQVPDLEEMMASNQRWWDWKKDIRKLWVRGTLSYDDPDNSPDGEQLFGEVEDHGVTYMVMNKKPKEY